MRGYLTADDDSCTNDDSSDAGPVGAAGSVDAADRLASTDLTTVVRAIAPAGARPYGAPRAAADGNAHGCADVSTNVCADADALV